MQHVHEIMALDPEETKGSGKLLIDILKAQILCCYQMK